MDPAKTIGIDLWAGQARGLTAQNHATCYRPAVHVVERWGMRDMFIGAYERFATLCREVDEPGIAMLAVDEFTGMPAGLVRLRARPGRHVAAIIGRHDACDLFLDRHASLALRHLAVVLAPVTSWKRGETNVRYRIFDLRTETGFMDEHGKTMHGLRAEGPALLRVANHAIFVLPLGDATDWPVRASDAWSMLPERVYFDEMTCRPEGSLTAMPINSRTRKSMLYRTHGPRETGQGLVERGDIRGTLEVIGQTKYGRMKIGEEALRDGVLLGRYARCDGAALLEDQQMSRVHALLLQIDDDLMLIDTASRNGSYLPGQAAARVIPVTPAADIQLGKYTRIRWHWAD